MLAMSLWFCFLCSFSPSPHSNNDQTTEETAENAYIFICIWNKEEQQEKQNKNGPMDKRCETAVGCWPIRENKHTSISEYCASIDIRVTIRNELNLGIHWCFIKFTWISSSPLFRIRIYQSNLEWIRKPDNFPHFPQATHHPLSLQQTHMHTNLVL